VTPIEAGGIKRNLCKLKNNTKIELGLMFRGSKK